MNTESKMVSLLSIDAWRDTEGGWQWNNWHKVATVPASMADMNPRALLKQMRMDGYLRADSAGRCAVEDDGYNVVIVDRANRCPVFAIAYGEAI